MSRVETLTTWKSGRQEGEAQNAGQSQACLMCPMRTCGRLAQPGSRTAEDPSQCRYPSSRRARQIKTIY